MIKRNQDGAVNGLMLSLIATVVLLLAVAGFAVWAFSSRQQYKNDVDAKINAAVTVAKAQAAQVEQQELIQAEKQPYLSYNGPPQYGAISFQYPKTWSAYINTSGIDSGSVYVDGYFMPSILSSVNDQTANFALRVQILNQAYSQVVQQLQSQAQNPKSGITVTAFKLPKLPNVIGVEASGYLSVAPNNVATMIVMPDRTNTIQFWTDGTAYLSDFNNIIVPSFDFSP